MIADIYYKGNNDAFMQGGEAMFKRCKRTGKKLTQQEVYKLIYHANNIKMVKTFTDDECQWLLNFVKHSEIDGCLCCPCFAWKFTEDKEIDGFMCTIGGNPDVHTKGQCPDKLAT